MKYLLTTFLFSLIVIFRPFSASAIVDPLSVPNNKVGIHIIDQNDLGDAIRLVNSAGGDWGYVTLVLPLNDLNKEKWQGIFDSMRRNHLIPIIRLATRLEGDRWAKPNKEDVSSVADFLDSLNWVTKNRYIVLFNEPNHAKEWGGQINPIEYAEILKTYKEELKKRSGDFFILPAGLDASAPNGEDTMDEEYFLERMNFAKPGIFNDIDGWTAHSYPNPNFSAPPTQTGRQSIRNFDWEIETLKKLGLTKSLPIFITETGWTNHTTSLVSIASYFLYAYKNVWNDSRIVAVTPFILNYPQPPFDIFSWKNQDQGVFYPQYFEIINMPKIKGEPIQDIKLKWKQKTLPKTLVTNSSYIFDLSLKNDGQSIFSKENGFEIIFAVPDFDRISILWTPVEPKTDENIKLRFHTPQKRGRYDGKIDIIFKGKKLISQNYQFELLDPPSLFFKADAFMKPLDDDLSEILIYDRQENVVAKFERVPLKSGIGMLENLRNIALGERYRVVIKKPYYLPRQTYTVFEQGVNNAKFKTLLPLDLNLDSKFSFADYWGMIFHPIFTLSLIF